MSGEFKSWVEGYGIEHRQAGGDPTALMKLSAEHKVGSSRSTELMVDVLSWLFQGVPWILQRVAR